MRIYFIDKQWLGPDTETIQYEAFTKSGMTISFESWSSEDEIIKGAVDADAIMVVAVPISRRVIEALPNLKFIGRCGIGYDSVDLIAATERGIAVCNVPDYCAYEVASHSFTLMIALKKQLIPFLKRAKDGGYGQGSEYICHRLKGQVLGLLGYGRISRELAVMARGMGMNILVFDPYIKEINDSNTKLCKELDEVLKESDVISVHTPLTPDTKYMMSMAQFKLMKKSAVIINTSRGPVINTNDFIEALKTGVIAAAGLDVCEGEPLPVSHELLKMDNVLMTPHVAMYSEEAMIDLHKKLTKQALDVLAGRWTNNIVNPDVKTKKDWK